MKKQLLIIPMMLFSLAVWAQDGGADHFKIRTDYLEIEDANLQLLDPLSVKVLAVDANGVVGYTTVAGGSGDGLWESGTSGASSYISYNTILGDLRIGNDLDRLDLYASGKIYTTEVIVQASVPVPDYVFEEGYPLQRLDELERFLETNSHLPGIPSAREINRDGLNLSEMNLLLLKKVEELTLYLLDQEKRIRELEQQQNKQ